MIIAIDGPAASGKSTTALGVARRLGFVYLDTGAMYRAVTLAVLRAGLSLQDSENIDALLRKINLRFVPTEIGTWIYLDDQDATESIRSPDVTASVSAVSALPTVRRQMVEIQRETGGQRDSVVEGRDIGTVVFPDAEFKFFLTADYRTRAERRVRDLAGMGIEQPVDDIVRELKHRDEKDSSRNHSPLRKAEGAIEVDTTDLTIDEQVDFIVSYVKKRSRERDTS